MPHGCMAQHQHKKIVVRNIYVNARPSKVVLTCWQVVMYATNMQKIICLNITSLVAFRTLHSTKKFNIILKKSVTILRPIDICQKIIPYIQINLIHNNIIYPNECDCNYFFDWKEMTYEEIFPGNCNYTLKKLVREYYRNVHMHNFGISL